MRYKLIDTNKAMMPVDRMCRMMAVSVSGYYAWKDRKPSLHQCYDVVLAAHIRAQFHSSNQTYGAPRMHAELREEGLSVGRHRVACLMRENGLKAHQKRRFKKTTDSHHDCCSVPTFDGTILTVELKEELWARFYTGAPRQLRQSLIFGSQYNIVKRA